MFQELEYELISAGTTLFLANLTYWGTKTVGAGAEGIKANIFSGILGTDRVNVMLTAEPHCHIVSFMRHGDDGKGV